MYYIQIILLARNNTPLISSVTEKMNDSYNLKKQLILLLRILVLPEASIVIHRPTTPPDDP